ncbi:MAG: chitobiase/beta-hexosaminidase C-terminal domain-containing protein [Lachnospiraceae bacterium]|nr:chitobiase/beta-hexosaminidase C-terminal domain-containing protein [Lachnospiraceae bacterium]
MKRKKSLRLVSVFLCAVMLFTSESMSCLAYAAPMAEEAVTLSSNEAEPENDISSDDEAVSTETPDKETETPDMRDEAPDSEEETPVTEKPSDENVTPPNDGEEPPVVSDGDNSKETDPDGTNDSEQDSENDAATDTPIDSDTSDTEEPPTADDNDAKKEEVPVEEDDVPVEESRHPSDSISDNSVSANTLASSAKVPEVTDFVIVDEGGNVLDETQTVYLDQNKTRKFSVRPTPEDAFYDEVLWESDNPRVSVTDGTVALAPSADDSSENVSLTATVTAQIGEIRKTCKVEFLPLIEDVVIVDQDGNEVPETGLTIEMGEQKKLSVKVLPEGASADVSTRWSTNNSDLYVNDNGVMYVFYRPYSLPRVYRVTAEITVRNMLQKTTIKKEFRVEIPDVVKEPLSGDIQVSCSGMGALEEIDSTTWRTTIDPKDILTKRSNIKLFYTGSESQYTIFYENNGRELYVEDDGWVCYAAQKYDAKKGIDIDPKYPLHILVGTGDRSSYKPEKHSPVYTIYFKECNTDFFIYPRTLYTVPASADQELKVTLLPDGAKMEDIVWTSGDERLVKIKDRTEKGVMLQFGQIVGTTVITGAVKDHKGQNRYAACTVNISMQVPMPEFSSEVGGEMLGETPDGDLYDYWMIDKGGKLELSVKGVPNAQIYYTTNGSDPTEYGKLYQTPITINAKTKVRAYAKLKGYQDSWECESEFRIGNPKISVSPTAVSMSPNSSRLIRVSVPSWADQEDVFWESSNENIAYVDTEDIEDSEGYYIGCRHIIVSNEDNISGSCTLTAFYFDYAGREQTATCRVTVTGKLGITKAITMTEESSAEIRITKMPGGVPRDEISWFADNLADYSYIDIETAPNGNGLISVDHLPDTSEPKTVIVYACVDLNTSDDILDWESAYAYCEVTIIPKQYTVRFLGWNDKPAKTESLGRGQSATPPEDAVMRAAAPEGYLFDGWQNLADCQNITKDTDIYAKPYLETSFSITYMTGSEGSNSTANPAAYKASDKTITLSDAVPADSTAHKFAGWYRNSLYDGSPIDEIPAGTTGDLILYAKWVTAKTGLRIEPIQDQPYTGKAIKPEVEVYDGETLLAPGTDYTIAYKNNTNACMMPWADPKKAPTVTVKGKGNYGGSDTATFQILPQSIALEESTVVIPDLYMNTTGKKIPDTPTVTWNGKKLKYNTDFAITQMIKDNVVMTSCAEEGVYTVTIAGKGNFSGTRDISLTVTGKALLSKVKFTPLTDFIWTGSPLGENRIDPQLTYMGNLLLKGTDYTVSYNEAATEIGTYEAVFTAMGDVYAGTVTKTFKITGKPITASRLDIQGLNKLTYNGDEQTQTLTISYKEGTNRIPMTLGTDYTLDYDNATNVGKKAFVIITGINGYTGTVKKTFQISPYSLEEGYQSEEKPVKISLLNRKNYYEKSGAKPKISVMYQNTLLSEGRDYTVTYKNNKKVAYVSDRKPPTFTVKGKGNFSGSVSLTFDILPQDIGKLTATADDVVAAAPNTKKGETVGKTGKGKYKSTPKITDINGKALTAGTDFLRTYTFTDENGVVLGPKDQVPAGSLLTVTLHGTNNYTGEKKVSYRVLAAKMSLKGASISLKKGITKTYDLEPVVLKKEDLVVKLNGKELTADNYTIVSYMNNRKKGTAKVTIQGVGEYGGQKTVNFKINPRKIAWFKTP